MELEIETSAVENGVPAAEGGSRTRTDVAVIRDAIVNKLTYAIGKRVVTARPRDWFVATALTVRRTSSSFVCQLQTLTRIARMPRQVVAVKNASPVAAMAAITSSVRWS